MSDRVTKLARLALLTAAAVILGYVEYLLPVFTIPGVKLGLSNTVLIYAVYLMDKKSAALLMLLKVGISGLLFSGPFAMLYSLAGGVFSLVAMLLTYKNPHISVIGVSVLGAICHNAGQFTVACFTVGAQALAGYIPVLILAAVAAGALNGVIAKYVLHAMQRTKP